MIYFQFNSTIYTLIFYQANFIYPSKLLIPLLNTLIFQYSILIVFNILLSLIDSSTNKLNMAILIRAPIIIIYYKMIIYYIK